MKLPVIERDEYVVSLQPYEDADGSILELSCPQMVV